MSSSTRKSRPIRKSFPNPESIMSNWPRSSTATRSRNWAWQQPSKSSKPWRTPSTSNWTPIRQPSAWSVLRHCPSSSPRRRSRARKSPMRMPTPTRISKCTRNPMQGHLQSFCWKGADRPFQIHPGGIVEELQYPLALCQVQQNWMKFCRKLSNIAAEKQF